MLATNNSEVYLFLLAHASAHDYVRFFKTHAIDGRVVNELDLVARWRSARAQLETIRSFEANDSTGMEVSPIPDQIASQANELIGDRDIQQCIGVLPHRWAMVELDQLILRQKYVNLTHATQLAAKVPTEPSDQELLQIAVGSLDDVRRFALYQMAETTSVFLRRQTTCKY